MYCVHQNLNPMKTYPGSVISPDGDETKVIFIQDTDSHFRWLWIKYKGATNLNFRFFNAGKGFKEWSVFAEQYDRFLIWYKEIMVKYYEENE